MSGQRGYSSNGTYLYGTNIEKLKLKFTEEQINKILKFTYPNCKIINIIMKRANEIYKGINNEKLY